MEVYTVMADSNQRLTHLPITIELNMFQLKDQL